MVLCLEVNESYTYFLLIGLKETLTGNCYFHIKISWDRNLLEILQCFYWVYTFGYNKFFRWNFWIFRRKRNSDSDISSTSIIVR